MTDHISSITVDFRRYLTDPNYFDEVNRQDMDRMRERARKRAEEIEEKILRIVMGEK